MLRRRAEARGGQRGEDGGIGLAVGQRLQHAAGADAQQIGDEARELDVRFLEQRFQAVLQLDAVARDLVLAPHHGPPEPLLGVGHKAQGQLLSDQPLHQPLRIREILLAPAGSAIRLRLGEMQRARHARSTRARPALRPPVPLQDFPHRPPVLRGRFHDDFLDLTLDEPVGQLAQVGGAGPDLLTFKVVLAVDLDVGHDDRQHLLVDVNSRDPVRHRSLLRGAESVPRRISQGRELSSELTGAPHDAQLFTQSRTLRTTQLLGLNSSTGWFDLAAPDRIVARADFHRLSRAAGPRQQLRIPSLTPSHSPSLAPESVRAMAQWPRWSRRSAWGEGGPPSLPITPPRAGSHRRS